MTNCFGILKFLFAFRHVFSNYLKKLLTNSLVPSRFDYGDTVYGNFINKSGQNKIQKIENFCILHIYNGRKFNHISHKLNKRRKFHFGSFILNLCLK